MRKLGFGGFRGGGRWLLDIGVLGGLGFVRVWRMGGFYG